MKTCLIIDDDAKDRARALELLQGHDLRLHAIGRERIDRWDFGQSAPDLVLLDIPAPGEDDLSSLSLLLQHPERQVIVCSRDEQVRSALRVLRHGAHDFLPKPFEKNDLHARVDEALSRMTRNREQTRLSSVSRERIADLLVFGRITRLITSSQPMETWIQRVVEATCSHIGAESGALLLLDRSADCLSFFAFSGPAGELVREIQLQRGDGLAWTCMESGQAIRVDDVRADPRHNRAVDAHCGSITRNLIAVPLCVHDERIGIIELVNKIDAEAFSATDLCRLTELADYLGAAVHNALIAKELERSRNELARMSHELGQVVQERTDAIRRLRSSNRLTKADLVRTAREAQQINEALLESEKTAILGTLAAGVSHEINNPLGFVSNNVAVLRDYVRSLYRLAAVVHHAGSRRQSGSPDTTLKLFQEAERVISDENIPAIMTDIGPLFEETQRGLGQITDIVEHLHRIAEPVAGPGEEAKADVVGELERLADLVKGAGKSPLVVEILPGDRPLVHASVMALRLMLLSLLGHFTRRKVRDNRLVASVCHAGPMIALDLEDRTLEPEDCCIQLSASSADGDPDQTSATPSMVAAQALAGSLGGAITVRRLPDLGYVIRILLPAAEAIAMAHPAG